MQALHGACRPELSAHDLAIVAYLLITNLTLIAQDLVEFVSLCGRPASGFLLVSQAWSVGMEVWFYLLTPWLVRLRTGWLLGLAGLSILIRLLFAASDLPFYPWQQRFMPAELFFFLAGIVAYRTRGWWRQAPRLERVAGWCALVMLLALAGSIGWVVAPAEPNAATSLAFGLLMMASVPPMFSLTARWPLDRAVGELSYPIYLWHIFLGIFVSPIRADATGVVYLGLVTVLAVATVLLVEQPVARWRHRRVTAGQVAEAR